MYQINISFLLSVLVLLPACTQMKENAISKQQRETTIPSETKALYTSYKNLVMAGYQGWFAAEGDSSQRGWYHYGGACGFAPGCSTIDFWPDVSEYTKKYVTPFTHRDGTAAYLYSPYDEESIDLHFKWMKTYGIDGVFMQRFLGEIKTAKGKRHFNKVLQNALKAAKKYERAICIMYDLSGSSAKDMSRLLADWDELQKHFDLFNVKKNPTYLRHDGRPLLAIWGAGFDDGRKYSVSDIQQLVSDLKGPQNKISIMLGVPYYWRTLSKDTENSPLLHPLIKSCDIVMPWAVGRYHSENYDTIAKVVLTGDIQWCKENNVTYVPLVFPGFSWGNLKRDPNKYNLAPRLNGDFLWKQIAGARLAGAESLYVAMFDEVDEGTAIFKTMHQHDVPDNGDGRFIGIEEGLGTDYYLWLTGQGTRWFHGDNSFNRVKPKR